MVKRKWGSNIFNFKAVGKKIKLGRQEMCLKIKGFTKIRMNFSLNGTLYNSAKFSNKFRFDCLPSVKVEGYQTLATKVLELGR